MYVNDLYIYIYSCLLQKNETKKWKGSNLRFLVEQFEGAVK